MPDDLTVVFTDDTLTSSTPAPTCPECAGKLLLGHPGGVVFAHDTMRGCSLQNAEDARALADRTLADVRGWPFERPATSTERTLLAAAGYELPNDAVTVVDWLTTAVRRRRWPSATEAVLPVDPAVVSPVDPAVVSPVDPAVVSPDAA